MNHADTIINCTFAKQCNAQVCCVCASVRLRFHTMFVVGQTKLADATQQNWWLFTAKYVQCLVKNGPAETEPAGPFATPLCILQVFGYRVRLKNIDCFGYTDTFPLSNPMAMCLFLASKARQVGLPGKE